MQLYDSVDASVIPADAEAVAGYVDGRYRWSAADWARFRGLKLGIAVFATDDGDVLDVEAGDATPDQAPGWVVRQRARGIDPIVYCSRSAWPAVRAAFAAAGVPEPRWWIAQYDGDPTLAPGEWGHQYAGNVAPGVDLSVIADQPASPAPRPSVQTKEVTMFMTDPETGIGIATDADGNLYVDEGGIPDLRITTLGQHPEWHAGAAASGGQNPCVGITPWKDPTGRWGYCYWTKPASGHGSCGPYSTYHIRRDGTPD